MFGQIHWGTHAWAFIESIALTYPVNPTPQEKAEYKEFFLSLQYVLPCPRCRNHFKSNIEKYPLNDALKNRENLIKWVIDVHNEVNKSNGKRVLSYEEARKRIDGKFIFGYEHVIGLGIVLGLLFYLSRKLK